MSTKIHLAVDALGRPIRVLLTGGQRNDITQAQAQALRAQLADCGYDCKPANFLSGTMIKIQCILC